MKSTKHFAWMELPTHRRQVAPQEFSCTTMRALGQFSFGGLKVETFLIPFIQPNGHCAVPGLRKVYGRVLKANSLSAKIAAEQAILWLSPELVDFAKPIRITFQWEKVKQRQWFDSTRPGSAARRRPYAQRPPSSVLGQDSIALISV